VIIADTPEGRVRAHCPNPGRLTELLVPGRRLILERRDDDPRNAGARTDGAAAPENSSRRGPRTAYTLVGGYYAGRALSLYSARANAIARELILPRLFPNMTGVDPEPRHAGGRFDFAVETPRRAELVEVKACTLIHAGVGMFPDAVSARAVRHLRSLAELERSTDAPTGHLLFVLMRPDAQRFVPDLHTDPDFARALRDIAGRVRMHAATVEADASGRVELRNPDIPIDLEPVSLVDADGGVYMLVIERDAAVTREIGSLGRREYPAGYYVYVGSGRRNLSARVQRHLRRRKKLRWHVDHLIQDARRVRALPIYSAHDLECRLADAVRYVAEGAGGHVVRGFGSSDCSCKGHLMHFPVHPLRTETFIQLLLDFRHDHALRKHGDASRE
jgi:sugar fermentation stimulation protein A